MEADRPAYLNGRACALAGLTVSVLDHGFLYGDGVYEVVPVFHRKPRCLPEHLARLANSVEGIGLRDVPSTDELRAIITDCIERSPDDDHIVYLQISRGTPPPDAPWQKVFPPNTKPTVFAMTQPRPEPPSECAAILRDDRRWGCCYLKTTMLLESVLSTQAAHDAGAAEAILHRGDTVTEGATSNVFAVVDGTIRTPELSPQILPGVTRGLLLRLLAETSYTVHEGPLTLTELAQASEVWLTGSTRGVLPVVRIDDQPVGTGTVGIVTAHARTAYQNWCAGL